LNATPSAVTRAPSNARDRLRSNASALRAACPSAQFSSGRHSTTRSTGEALVADLLGSRPDPAAITRGRCRRRTAAQASRSGIAPHTLGRTLETSTIEELPTAHEQNPEPAVAQQVRGISTVRGRG
jgi:hypothetical protein